MQDEPTKIPVFDPSLIDRREPEQAIEERRRVKEQLATWEATRQNPDVRERDRRNFIGRRAGRRDLVQVEAVDNNGSDTFVVARRLLITRADFDGLDDRRRALLTELGLVASPVPGLRGTVLQLDDADPCAPVDRSATVDIARALRDKGVPVRPNYVAPLGMIRKADGGPENSGWVQQVPDVPVSGPLVAVIDTGISVERRDDGWLRGLERGDNVDLLDVIPQPTDHRLDLGAGHGTFVAGVVQQVAPGVNLRIYQTLDTDGAAGEATVAAAILTAAHDGALIINLSLGTDTLEPEAPMTMRQAVVDAIAIEQNILLVCAAGNFGDDRACWPAAFHREFPHNVVSVAALGRDEVTDAITGAGWSSHGDVTCSTMGEGVVSTYVIGTETDAADTLGPDTFGSTSWATWSGTSFAAPQITGAIVKVMQDPAHIGVTPRAALDIVLKGSVPLTGYGRPVIVLPA